MNRLQSSNNATRQHSAGVFTLLLLPLQSSDCATQHEHISFVTFCIVFLCILRNQTVLDIFLFKMYPSAPSNCQRTSLHPYASYIILWRVEHILYHKTFIKVGSMNLIWWHFSASFFLGGGGGGLLSRSTGSKTKTAPQQNTTSIFIRHYKLECFVKVFHSFHHWKKLVIQIVGTHGCHDIHALYKLYWKCIAFYRILRQDICCEATAVIWQPAGISAQSRSEIKPSNLRLWFPSNPARVDLNHHIKYAVTNPFH